MKISTAVSALVAAFLLLPVLLQARDVPQPSPSLNHYNEPANPTAELEKEVANLDSHQIRSHARGLRRHDTVQVAGSSLPDCSHACGSCTPCRLVTVSLVCASLAEAETCPVSYKCMCNSKSYPVP